MSMTDVRVRVPLVRFEFDEAAGLSFNELQADFREYIELADLLAYLSEPFSFKDDLSKVLDDATYNGDASSGATVKGSTLSWSGALKAGATTKVTYSVTVNDPDTGNKKLTNAVVPTDPTGSCATDGGCTTDTTVTPLQPTSPVGPSVATGGTVLSPAPVWPWIGSGALALAGMVTLGLMGLRRRGQNLGD